MSLEHFIFSLGLQRFLLFRVFGLLIMKDFLGGGLLLFDPVALFSVHHLSGRKQWAMGLCASEIPVLAL